MKIHATIFALLYTTFLLAQHPEVNLPRYLTAEEQQQMLLSPPEYDPTSGLTNPPAGPVRSMAEWEELQALVITWRSQPTILTEIVRAARLECKVIICCNDQATITSAQNYLTSNGVDISSNVQFLLAPNNSIWVRDYGPNCVYLNNVDSLYFVDWKYNRTTRPKDDTIATTVSQYLNVPLYTTSLAPTDLVNTGGNFMSDGAGTAFASQLILSENQVGNPYNVSTKTEPQINGILHDFMGIQRYIKMATLPYDEIHHIDMHMKLLDEETLLVGKYPAGTADGPQIEANIQYVLNNYTSVFGTPYKVIRIPMPPQNGAYPNSGGDYRTYANAVFVNKTVILPFYETQYDTTAARIWQEAMPGYRIVGVDCNAIIPSLGAIHCITKEIGVNDPIHVVHQELACQNNAAVNGYPVFATLEHRTGIASAAVFYAVNPNGPWQQIGMQLVSDTTNVWAATIPEQAAGGKVYYYIQATGNSGKTVVHPLPAPDGTWSFCVTNLVATDETPIAALLDVYPNPAASITCIPVRTTTKTIGTIELFNALGQLVETVYAGTLPTGDSNYFLDAGHLVAGIYFVKLQTGGGVLLKKLVVK